MAIHKVSVIFDAPATGWTETYFVDAVSPEIACEAFRGTWALARMALVQGSSTAPIHMIGTRAHDVETNMGTFSTADNFAGAYVAPLGVDPEMPWSGILCRVVTNSAAKRPLKLLGIADDVCAGTWNTPTSNTKFAKAFFDFAQVCIRLAFRVQSVNKAGTVLHTITGITAGLGKITVTTAAGHGLVDNDVIRWDRVDAAIPISGKATVFNVTATTFDVGGYNVGNVGFVRGKFQKVAYSYPQWREVNIQRKTKRPTGRPFFLLRGRKPVRK